MKKAIVFLLLLFIFLPFRLRDVFRPLVNITNFRQAQTATIIKNYYHNGIDLLSSELDIFGKGKERFLTLEFPLYEASVAILHRMFFVHDVWGRGVSMLAGFISALYLYKLVFFFTRRTALSTLTAFFFLSVPVNMFHQKDILIEAFTVCFLIVGFYYSIVWIRTNTKISFILSILCMSTGYIQKGMYGPFYMIPMVYYYLLSQLTVSDKDERWIFARTIALWKTRRFTRLSDFSRKEIAFFCMLAIPLASLFIWQQHMNAVNVQNGQAYFSTTNPDHVIWNLGTWGDRLSWPVWEFRLRNVLNGIFLKPGLLVFLFGLIFIKKLKNWKFFAVWLISEFLYFLIFFRIQSHIYYQMVMVPPIAVVMAHGVIRTSRFLRMHAATRAGFVSLLCAVLLWRFWISSQWDAVVDWEWYKRIQKVGHMAPAGTWGIFVQPGHDWNSVYTYFPKLKMKVVGAEDVTMDAVSQWKQEGYAYILLHEPQKYPDYLALKNPGHTLDFLSGLTMLLENEEYRLFLL